MISKIETSKKIEILESSINELYEKLPVEENEEKGILCISYLRDKKNQTITVSQTVSTGSNISMARAIILLLKDKEELEIQNIFECVKENV